MRSLILCLAVLSAAESAFAQNGPKLEPCPMTEAQGATAAGMKVTKMVQHVSQWQGTQCDFTMENGEIQLMRVPPSARNLTTEAELAADFAAKEARRVLKDFPVPAYSFGGGLYVVTPKGVWSVLARRGPGGGLDPQKVARALIEKLR